MTDVDSDLDLVTSRVIRAPRARVWRAWADPDQLARWWIPRPMLCRVVAFDLRPGGAFVTEMADAPGAGWTPHMNACFLEVVPNVRIVYTDLLVGGWRPAPRGFVTGVVTMEDHEDGTLYTARACHRDQAGRDRHAELGFHEGWSTVIAQLALLTEQEPAVS